MSQIKLWSTSKRIYRAAYNELTYVQPQYIELLTMSYGQPQYIELFTMSYGQPRSDQHNRAYTSSTKINCSILSVVFGPPCSEEEDCERHALTQVCLEQIF